MEGRRVAWTHPLKHRSFIGTEDEVVRAWTVRRLVEGQRWSKEAIDKMHGTPKRPDPNMAGLDAPIRISVKASDPTAEVEYVRRNRAEDIFRPLYFKREDFEKYGYTDGC